MAAAAAVAAAAAGRRGEGGECGEKMSALYHKRTPLSHKRKRLLSYLASVLVLLVSGVSYAYSSVNKINRLLPSKDDIQKEQQVQLPQQQQQHPPPPSRLLSQTSSEIVPDHFMNNCLVRANNRFIRSKEAQWTEQGVPEFCSLQISIDRHTGVRHWMAVFSTVHIVWKTNDQEGIQQAKLWAHPNTTTWYCNQEKATIVGGGCPQGTTFVVQCPQPATENISKIQFESSLEVYKMTYRVLQFVECFRNEPLVKPVAPTAAAAVNVSVAASKITAISTASVGNRVAGTAIFFGPSARNPHEILEWVEYHRLIGVEHFYMYLMASYDPITDWNLLPNLSYITWIPWDFVSSPESPIKNRAGFLSFQIAQQTDAILRARADGMDWVAMNDVDEYIQLMDGETTLNMSRYVIPSDRQTKRKSLSSPCGGVMGRTINFGQHPYDETKRIGRPSFLIEYTYRAVTAFPRRRQKVVVSTHHTDYYNNHRITLSDGYTNLVNEWNQLRIVHYKRPGPGVYLRFLANKTVEYDAALRDAYLDRLAERMDDLKRTMIMMNQGQIRTEWLWFDHLVETKKNEYPLI